MENKYVNMSHNYKIMTQAGRITESSKMQQKIKNNPSKLKDEINNKTFNLKSLIKEIEILKEEQSKLETVINNYKNNPYIATKFLTGLENNLEKVIKEIALKEKEKSILEQNL